MTPYECGTCGSMSLRIEPLPEGWRVSCGNGHAIAPSLGTVILAETGPLPVKEQTADPAEHPDHPHGSTVEQVHRILGQAYADEPDRWMLAEELVKFVTKQVAQGTTAADDAFLAELVQAFAKPLTPEDLSAPTDRLSIVESLIRAGRLKAGRPSTIPEHLAEAERLLGLAFADNDPEHAPGGYYDDHANAQVRAAEVHARIAHAMTAAEMLQAPQENPSGPLPPGLASLTKLADAMDRIAAGWERDQESTFSGRRGPTE